MIERFSVVLLPEGRDSLKRARNTLDINVDSWFHYPSLRNYYGPSSILDVLRFRALVEEKDALSKKVRVVSREGSAKRSNGVFLVGAYLVWWGGMRAEQVVSILGKAATAVPAYQTEGEESYPDLLNLSDCIRALETFRDAGLVNPESLDAAQIVFWEDPENGDMNWIVPGKILAFAGPDHGSLAGFIAYAKEHGIKGVVRLNEHEYEAGELEAGGIQHLDLPMVDGSVPSLQQITHFHAFAHPILTSGAAIAIHCRAGLGRTGTILGSYLIRQHSLPARQMIAFARIMRPGCFLAKQPRFVEAVQWWLRGEDTTEVQKDFIEAMLGDELAAQLESTPFDKMLLE